MAKRPSIIHSPVQGATTTSHGFRVAPFTRVLFTALTFNHLLLAPWIIFTIPPASLFQQQLLVAGLILVVGVGGMIRMNKAAATAASLSLVGLIVWSKVRGDIYGLPGPDTAILLLQFLTTIFLMEASTTAITFRERISLLSKMNDKVSEAALTRLNGWAVGQIAHLGELTVGAFLLSLGLLVLGSLIGVAVDQLAVTGIMVLAATVAILILLTYRRETEPAPT